MAETKHSSDMVVARVVEAIGKCMVGSSLEEQAIAALAASHHAELVAITKSLIWGLEHHWDDPVADAVQKRRVVRAAKIFLAKIGGGA